MIKMTRKIVTAMLTAVLLFCGAAWAGPQMTFGPDDKGSLQIDYKGQFQIIMRDTGSGPSGGDDTMSFNFRRNRLAFMGSYGDVVSLYVQTEFTDNQYISPLGVSSDNTGTDFTFLDSVIRFNFSDAFKLNVGRFKYNFNRETLEACEAPLTLDRSLFIRPPYVTTRDRGLAVWGNFLDGMLQYRADIMEGRAATTSAAITPESNFRYSVRGHVSLLDPEQDYGYKGTYLGKKKVLTLGAAYQAEPKVAYKDTVGRTGDVDYTGWTADVFLEYPVEGIGTFTASYAYEKIELDEIYKGASPDSDAIGLNGEKNGFYAKAGYQLPQMPLQFFGRYEKWSFASLQNIIDQEITWIGGGLNYYVWDQNLKVTVEFSSTDFAKEDAVSKDFSTVITQLQLVF